MNKNNHRTKKPWPTKAAMEQVYAKNLWGGDAGTFYSGEGSHRSELVDPYIAVVSVFLSSFDNPLTICDLGCGDFNVGKQLTAYIKHYIGVDIVQDLISFNQKKYRQDSIGFQCLDLAKDPLPVGDVAMVRQVLQHLSNEEVQRILDKLSHYKYIILTEHLPDGSFTPNKDIISGQGIRLKKQSGIDILAPPFNFEILHHKQLLSIQLAGSNGRIVTTLYQVFE